MEKTAKTIIIVSFAFLFQACIECDTTPRLASYCPYEGDRKDDQKYSLAEEAVFNYCVETQIMDSVTLRNNMLGTWELVGYYCSIPVDSDVGCESFQFNDTSVIYSFEGKDTQYQRRGNWRVEKQNDRFVVLSDSSVNRVFDFPYTQICDEYMVYFFGGLTARFDYRYIYKKTNG